MPSTIPPCDKQLTVQATVTSIQQQQAEIRLIMQQQKHCSHCQGHGGCRSFSLSHWLFGTKGLSLPNAGYHLGQKLAITFPSHLVQYSLNRLLGLPLAGFLGGIFIGNLHHELTAFLLGVFLSTTGHLIGKQQVQRHLSQQLTVNDITY